MARGGARGFGQSSGGAPSGRGSSPQRALPPGDATRQQALQAIRSGQLEQAADLYRQLIGAGQAGAADCSNLAAILLSRGLPGEAIGLLQRSLALDGTNPDSWLNLGTALHASGDVAAAADAFRRAIALRPAFAKAWANLGNTLQALQDLPGALEAYDRALAITPDYPEVLSNRGYALIEAGEPAEALASIERALALRPDHADAHNNRGLALRELGQLEAAIAAHQRALTLQPASADVLSNIGVVEMERGAIEAAVAAFEQALQHEPHHPLAHRHLALCLNGCRRPDALERSRSSLAALADDPERWHLHFALGKYLLDRDDPTALEQLVLANRLRRRQLGPSPAPPDVQQCLSEQRQRIMRLRAAAETDPGGAGGGDPGAPLLLFIVGLPRCGSTLVETILSQIDGVLDLGELPLLDRAIAAAEGGGSLAHHYRRLAAERRAPEAGCIAQTDKYLYNFMHCELIASALPGSRIVHVHRNPMDNLLSLFSNHFARGNAWTYDLDEAVTTYDRYRRLMAAQEQAMPGRIFHLSYDDLTRDPQGQLPPLLSHCGLPWDDACLSPHTSRRTIQTASAVQARQPIHAGSVGRWLRHAEALAPWAERLEALGWSTAIAPPPPGPPPPLQNGEPRR